VLRDHKRQNFRVVVGDLAQLFPSGRRGERAESNKAKARGEPGMRLGDLTTSGARLWPQGKRRRPGHSVEPDSFADESGCYRAMCWTSINHQPINTGDDVTRVRQYAEAPAIRSRSGAAERARGQREWATAFAAGTLPNPR